MQALIALTRANILAFARDRAAVGWTLAFPIGLIALFAALFSDGGAPRYDLAWADDARSSAAQDVRAALETTGAAAITEVTLEAGLDDVRAGRAAAVVHIPGGFGRDPGVRVRIVADPANQSRASAISALVSQALQSASGVKPVPVELVPIHGEVLRQISYLVPAIVAMALMQLGVFGAVTLVRHRERHVLKRLAAAPIGRSIVVASFVGSQLLVALVQTIVMLAAAVIIGGAVLSGNFLAIAGVAVLTAATFVAIGFVISGLARSEESATSITGFVTLPLLMLSGLFVPVDQLPDVLRTASTALPMTYAADAMRQVMVGAAPEMPLWLCVAVLAAWLLAALAAATRLFRWQ